MKELFKGCWTIPNLLSVIRIILIPFFAVFFAQGKYLLAILILVLSGLSDFFDGKIARKFNQISALGKMLDPVADKLTQMTLAGLLFYIFNSATDKALQAFSWVFLLFILKEIVMVIGGLVMILMGLRPGAAEIYGKAATMAFYIIMIIIFCFGPEVGALCEVTGITLPNIVLMVLVLISLILTIVAFFSYLPDVVRQFKERKAKKAE